MAGTAKRKIEPAAIHLMSKISSTSSRPAQQPDKERSSLWMRYNNSWIPEVLALTLSWSCIIISAVVLKVYDGKPNPDLHLGLTLNAFIAILATTSKVSLIFTISNSLGQLKWVWFLGSKPRSLLDAEIYDNASRGPLGALTMLGTRTWRSVAAIGAMLILLAVAYDPFVQQIIRFEAVLQAQSDPNDAVLVNQAKFFTLQTVSQPVSLNTAVWADRFDWKTTCSSTNCTWPTFESLAWHSNCFEDRNWTLSNQCSLNLSNNETVLTNLSSTFRTTTRNCAVSTQYAAYEIKSINLPLLYEINGYEVNETGYWILGNVTGPYITVQPLYVKSFPNAGDWGVWLPTPLFSLGTFYLRFKDDASIALEAYTCELDMRLNEYRLGTSDSNQNITILRSHPIQKWWGIQRQPTYNINALWLRPTPPTNMTLFADIDLPADNSPLIVNVSTDSCNSFCQQSEIMYNWLVNLNNILTFQGQNNTPAASWTGQNDSVNIFKDSAEVLSTLGGSANPSPLDYNDDYLAYHWYTVGPQQIMENMAAFLTKSIMDPSQNINSTLPVHGYAQFPVTIVRVSWLWVILPYGLCLAGTVFFLITVHSSRKAGAPLWKSSINAFFYHGIDYDWGTWRTLQTIHDMDAEAEVTRVRLAPIGLSNRLMLEKQLTSPHHND